MTTRNERLEEAHADLLSIMRDGSPVGVWLEEYVGMPDYVGVIEAVGPDVIYLEGWRDRILREAIAHIETDPDRLESAPIRTTRWTLVLEVEEGTAPSEILEILEGHVLEVEWHGEDLVQRPEYGVRAVCYSDPDEAGYYVLQDGTPCAHFETEEEARLEAARLDGHLLGSEAEDAAACLLCGEPLTPADGPGVEAHARCGARLNRAPRFTVAETNASAGEWAVLEDGRVVRYFTPDESGSVESARDAAIDEAARRNAGA